jgi:hypothetical protein
VAEGVTWSSIVGFDHRFVPTTTDGEPVVFEASGPNFRR